MYSNMWRMKPMLTKQELYEKIAHNKAFLFKKLMQFEIQVAHALCLIGSLLDN